MRSRRLVSVQAELEPRRGAGGGFLLVSRLSVLVLAGLAQATGALQAQHARSSVQPLPPALSSCEACHNPHMGVGSARALKVDGTSSSAPYGPSLGAVSRGCLRCHSTPALRSAQPEFLQSGLYSTQGSFLQFDLRDDHPLGLTATLGAADQLDATPELLAMQLRASVEPGSHLVSAGIECTTCHDPHYDGTGEPWAVSSHELCTRCHDSGRYSYAGHQSLECLSCHVMHGQSEFGLPDRQQGHAICLSCHSSGGGPLARGMLSGQRLMQPETLASPPMPREHLQGQGDSCLVCHPVHQ